MAHMIPETMLEFDPQGREDVVFNALKIGLGDDYWVLHSCNVNQTGRDGAFYEKEVDFVIYHREKGILCIEVKNGRGISYYGAQVCVCRSDFLWYNTFHANLSRQLLLQPPVRRTDAA